MTKRSYTNRSLSADTLVWEGVTLRVSYEPDYCDMGGDRVFAHLQLQVLEPAKAPLPVTGTGYRSHHLPKWLVEEAGGPLPYVKAWLDQEGRSLEWRQAQAAARQLDLFST